MTYRWKKCGCPTLHDMPVIGGEVVNKKWSCPIYREEGLQLSTRARLKTLGPRIPMLLPDAINQRSSMDVV